MSKVEKRFLSGSELRADGDELVISGVAAAYGVKSKNLGGFVERIAPSAFARSLREGADVKCLVNHDPNQILGRTKSGTLTLIDSVVGLRFRCQLSADSQAHRDLHSAVKRGDISECSFAFTVPAGGDDWNGEETDERGQRVKLRTLRDVTLMDVSCVTYPAYPQGTSVDARSADYHVRSTAALLARLDEMKADWHRHDRAHEITLRVIAEKYAPRSKQEAEEAARRARKADADLKFRMEVAAGRR
jgi:HK97 family phage prohead protease